MHTHKRVLTSAISLLLCFLTVFSCAFAYTQQQATSGYPQPPTYKGGNNSSNTYTTYTDPVIVGYRFTCWRSGDYQAALEKGLITDSTTRLQYMKSHNEPGQKLGHSINIMCNAVDADGNRRTDYANGYNQTGLKMPHMLTNGEQDDFLDKISLAQLEQKTDASNPNKITHSTATGLMLMNYAGSTDGNFEDTDESSWVEFYEPIYAYIDEPKPTEEITSENIVLSNAFKQKITALNPLKLYSGYYTRNRWNDGYLNGSADREGESNNLHTYIYGFQSKTQMGTSLEGYDRSDGVVTISDIDYEDLTGTAPVLPFNQNPSNVISTNNPKTWTNRNAALIAYLCGLTPRYGVPAQGDDENEPLSDNEFGVYDYIIVEPIMMYYYYNTRYYVTTSDTAILQAQSMRDKVGNDEDVWTSVYWGGYKLFDVCGLFPASFGTYVYIETPYFGVDGVFNATKENGYPTNAFQASNNGLDISSIASDSKNKSGNANRKNQDAKGWNTYATVFTTKSGHTLFTGGDHNMNRQVDRDRMRIRDGQDSYFLAPYIAVESLLGAGVFMSGNTPGSGEITTNYEIIYHANPNSGGANNKQVVTQTVLEDATSMKLWDYQTALNSKGLQPVGKIPTSYWTFTSGPNGYGIPDNTISSQTKTYPNTTKNTGKVAVATTVTGWTNIEKFFNTYGNYVPQTNTMEVHLYAAWNTKSLVTAIDRTYVTAFDNTTVPGVMPVRTLQDAALQDPSGSMWLSDINVVPKAISVVATVKNTMTVQDIIQLQKDTSTGYQWFQASGDTGNLDDPNCDYYVVYSFDKSAITYSDETAVGNALNGTSQNGLLIYRNNGAPVKWMSDINLFYFDYYTFNIEAPHCSIVASISDYPDADNSVTKQGSNGVLQMKLVRGSHITYTVTPDYKQGYYFDTDGDFGTFLSWENNGGVTAHIQTNPDETNEHAEAGLNHLSWKNIKLCNSCQKGAWDTSETKCPECNGASFNTYPARMYYYGANGTTKEVLGKQQHKYTVVTGKKITVVPYLDGAQMEPFENYFVDIVNTVTGQTYVYSATPMNGAIEIPSASYGRVTQAVVGNGQYHILVSATDKSGRDRMQLVRTVSTADNDKDETITINVYYYTASMSIKTPSGGNHSGIGGTLFYTTNNVNDMDAAISTYTTQSTKGASHTGSLCTEANYSFVKGIGLGASGSHPGLQLNVVRGSNSDWYMTSIKKNGAAQTISNASHASAFEKESSGSYVHQYANISAPYSLEYLAAPYHYISVYLDDQQVNATANVIGITTPSNHSGITDINGYTVLRGKYNTSVTSISSIIKGSDKSHITTNGDALSLNYQQDAVTYTTLYYYTVTTDADEGYSSTQILSSGGINAGNKAYILSNHTNYHKFRSCTTGNLKETDEIVTNVREYTASATLNSGSNYLDTSVSGNIKAYNTKVTKPTTFTKGTSTTISNVNAPSNLYWRSEQPRYDLKFVFRINSVPYDSLPQTVSDQISLDGNNQLTFKTDANGDVIATGTATVGTHTLYLNGLDTNMSYDVTSDTADNIYYIDFYTLRAAAGTGITQVSIHPTDVGNAWNGTLPYYRDGKKFATTLAVWPASMRNATSDIKNITVDALAAGEHVTYDVDNNRIIRDANGNRVIRNSSGQYVAVDEDGNTVQLPEGYHFNRWDTKRPTTDISITYSEDHTGRTSTLRQETIDASQINHATVVQAEATKDGTPIDIPTTPEHNSIYYGVKVRTFLDGRLMTPWVNMGTTMTLSQNEVHTAKLNNGVAPWATVLDLVASDGKTPVPDPYKGKSASALLAPSQEFEQNANINTEYFYSGSNAYIANQYTYIDAFYYTQTVQTQVNGVNTPPWNVSQYKEVLYKQLYKNTKVDTTKLVSVNEAGAFQTIMLKGMSLNVGGLPVANTSATASDYRILYTDFTITGNHAFIIPYYTVDMKAVCDTTGETINCSNLTLTFNGTSLKTSVTNNAPALVMEGSYSITTSDSGTSGHTDKCKQHSWLGWDMLANEVFILEYVDSGDGSHPYPVLTYTGESRPSTSKITSKTASSTQVTVNDETHLVARYGGSSSYALTLNSNVYDENGNLITPTINPIAMYRGDDNGAKYYTENGETNKYSSGTNVNVSATLDPQTIYYPTDISVTFKLTCPHCDTIFAYDNTITKCTSCGKKLNLQNASSSNVSAVYYATSDSYAKVQSVITEASMMPADAAAAYLAANHVIPMTKTATGTYTGTILYSEDTYHLYVNGEKQSASYDVKNNKKKEFVWGKPASTSITWDGTAGMNGNSQLTSVSYSDFHITMDKDRAYTAYARQVVTGEVPTSKSIDFVCVTIYTSTDYKTQFPYDVTYAYINGVKTQLSSASGHTFFVAKGSNLQLQAQRSQAGAYCDIYNATISGRKTFLLSYNTVTVSGDKNLVVGINGTDSQHETWLAHFAIDNGALQSANTEYSIFAEGGNITSKTFNHMDATVTIIAPLHQTLQLVAVEQPVFGAEEMVGTFEGTASTQYLYIFENTATNREKLDNYLVSQHPNFVEKYIVGFSTDPGLSGNLAKVNAMITFHSGVKYNVLVNWMSFYVDVIAAPGTTFTSGVNANKEYIFNNVPNGYYEIHMNGSQLVTNSADIKTVSGAVRKSNYMLWVYSTAVTTTSNSTEFSQWEYDNTPGTANTTTVLKGTTTSATHSAPTRTAILDGTINYNACSESNDIPGTGVSAGTATLAPITGYKVEVYLDDKLNTTFPKPVKFNGAQIPIQDGVSDTLYSIQFPTVSAVADAHDTGYTEVYGDSECESITYDAATKTFKVYYYSVTYGVNPSDGSLGEVLGQNSCTSEAWDGPLYVAKGSTVQSTVIGGSPSGYIENKTKTLDTETAAAIKGLYWQQLSGKVSNAFPLATLEAVQLFIESNGSTEELERIILECTDELSRARTLLVSHHTRVAAEKQVTGSEVFFTNWTKNENESIPLKITEPTHFVAHFTNTPHPYTVTLYNKSAKFASSLLDVTTDKLVSKSYYHLLKTTMTGGAKSSVSALAPETIFDTYLLDGVATLSTLVANPTISGHANSTTDIRITLTGHTSEEAHKVVLKNIETNATHICNVTANGFVATFTNVPTGYYQLYIDDIKYVTQFSYDTHDNTCKTEWTTGDVKTPHYETETGNGGILYVAPRYSVRYHEVSHWSQVRYNRVTGEYVEYANLDVCTDRQCSGYGTHAQAAHFESWNNLDDTRDPAYILYRYLCHECDRMFSVSQSSNWSNNKAQKCAYCSSTHIRMIASQLKSPAIDEDLDYYIYSKYTTKTYQPIDIAVEVEMAYPIYVQSVVDNVEQYPFYEDGKRIKGAKAFLEYTTDDITWHRLEASFDANGLATFYVPMGTTYRIVGAHTDEWAVSADSDIIDGGFALTNPYSTTGLDVRLINRQRYIVGDGDYNNDGDIDDPGLKYYVHYYTVTANKGHGIDDVNVHSSVSGSKYADVDSGTVTATYQRGATARVSAALADSELPVYIRLTRNNETYLGRTVWLSRIETINTGHYQLTYNEETGRYENNAVFGTAEGITYYVWADGQLVNGVYTSEYTGVKVVVKPYTEPVTWSGNCKHDTHEQQYNPDEHCDGTCQQSEVSHIALNDAPYTHSFVVYHTIVEQADAQNNVAKYSYRYADDHPLDPEDPEYDPEDPDNYPEDPDNPTDDPDDPEDEYLDEYPENTVYYYTLVVTGDAGTQQAVGSGTYLEGAVPNVNIGLQPVRQDEGRSPLTVILRLDNQMWTGQTVTIGGYPAREVTAGVYQTRYNFASGTYAVRVTSNNSTLVNNSNDTNIYGYIELSSTRTYTWKAWTDGHVVCSECGVTGACCEVDGTPKQCASKAYCTNCHLVLDSNKKEQSCCTTGDKKHTWTTCPYDGAVYNGNCLENLSQAQTVKANAITMKHDSYLHGVTTHVDNFSHKGDTTIHFKTLRLHGDAGIDYVDISNGKSTNRYQEAETITKHGRTAWSGTVFHRGLPERIWTDTRYERTFFQEVVVLQGQTVNFNAGLKQPVKNHSEAKTALSVELTLDGKPYTGRTVTIGGYSATDADNDGIYVTSYAGFVGGNTYQLIVDGRPAGRLYLESTRSYRWYTWDEPWEFEGDMDSAEESAHYCYYHKTTHACAKCLQHLTAESQTTQGWYKNHASAVVNDWLSYIARTQLIDEFHVYVDPNLDGGPDPYNPPTGDPDDPYKDPTDPDYPTNDPDDWTPGNDPEDNPNPEYDPDHKPEDNPEYDPVNPQPPVDPSDDPDDFDPDDPDDGFYEDAPVPFYTLTINTRLDDKATDDFPVKFENLTSGETLYIIPDGQTYHVYDEDGNRLADVPYIVSMTDGTVKIVLQDGDQYRVSVLDEIEDCNNNDAVDLNDINYAELDTYSYTTHTTGAIKRAPAIVNIDFYTLILDVYSDGAHKLPNFGKTVNGKAEQFESPVWLDDVGTSQDGAKNWWGESADSSGDTDHYAVYDHHTVKVYLKGQQYSVHAKSADDNITSRIQKLGNGYIRDFQTGTISGRLNVTVEYFSMTVDHHGGFTGTQINYAGKTHVSATTPTGATSNAIAQAFFLRDTVIEIDATVAAENTWYRWTGTATYADKNTKSIKMNAKQTESAWAKTYYTVRYYLHDKHEGWYEVVEDGFTTKDKLTIIDNRNWNSETVQGEPNKYVNFDPFRTHSFSDPTATTPATLRDVIAKTIKDTAIDVVVNDKQVGGQSFVDFYYTRNGSVVDPTPDTPTVPDPTPTPPEAPTPTPQKPEDWNVDEQKEYVTITYMVDDPNTPGINYYQHKKETYLAGTDITMVKPPRFYESDDIGTEYEFIGWFLTKLDPEHQCATGLLGTASDHYLLCTDTVVYAVYTDAPDLGITANDIYGVIKTGSQFTSSATIVNHKNSSITPNTHINAVLTVKEGDKVIQTIVVEDIVVPGNGTQMISAVVSTADDKSTTSKDETWSNLKTYTLTWSLDFSDSAYVDKDTRNNQSSLNSFKPNTYSSVVNTARPGYSTTRPSDYNKDADILSTSNTAFTWEYWVWNERSGYNGTFDSDLSTTEIDPVRGSDKMNIVILLTPENASGLRTYTTGAFGFHNYTTRSGYGLSMHRTYDDMTGEWAAKKSHITLSSNVGTLEALMMFPEFNYKDTYDTSTGTTQKYKKLTVASAGTYYSLTMPQYTDYETDDRNDQFAHYTPMWLPNGEYKPVTHVSGMWTPIGELRATIQQGQYTSVKDMNKYGIYTNEIIIKGSLYDDLYNNP